MTAATSPPSNCSSMEVWRRSEWTEPGTSMEGIEHSPNSMRRLGGEKTMSQKFAGKIALVTGGNSGIGLAAALAFAKEGAPIVITGRDQATLDKAAAQLGEK